MIVPAGIVFSAGRAQTTDANTTTPLRIESVRLIFLSYTDIALMPSSNFATR
jgi:hypothetical protein